MLKTFDTEWKYEKEPIVNVGWLRYTVTLVSYEGCEGINKKIVRQWPGLRFELAIKYQWYFRRVAALHQLQYPRHIVGFEWSRMASQEEKEISEKKSLKDKIVAAKSKVTQAENQLRDLKAGWKELFPIEQHPKWEATQKKLREKQTQLEMMERQLAEMA
jgi:hypothetical protein